MCIPEWDARRQSRTRIDRFATVSFVHYSLPGPHLWIGWYRDIAKRRLGADDTAKMEICRNLEETQEKNSIHTILWPWPTTGGSQCRFPGQIAIRSTPAPTVILYNVLNSHSNNPQPIGVCWLTTALPKITVHSSVMLCLWWCTKGHFTYGFVKIIGANASSQRVWVLDPWKVRGTMSRKIC